VLSLVGRVGEGMFLELKSLICAVNGKGGIGRHRGLAFYHGWRGMSTRAAVDGGQGRRRLSRCSNIRRKL